MIRRRRRASTPRADTEIDTDAVRVERTRDPMTRDDRPVIVVEDDPSALADLASTTSHYRCIARATSPVDVLVLSGCPKPETVHRRRTLHADAVVIAWDRRNAASSELIEGALSAGCEAVVSHPDPEVLLANIDAVWRRFGGGRNE